MSRRAVVTVYTRQGCHLCREAEDVATRVARGRADVRLVDIDRDPALLERYTVRVPVVAVDGREVAEYEVDRRGLRRALDRAGAHGLGARLAGWLGLLLLLVVGVFPFAATGLVAPAWGVAVAYGGWLVVLVCAWRLRPRQPGWIPALSGVALLWWLGLVAAGEWLLGWTA